MRGTKLVPEMGRMFLLEPDLRSGNAALAGAVVDTPGSHKAERSAWQSLPGSASTVLCSARCRCRSRRRTRSITGPAMGMRYSALVVRLVSPPMEAMPYTGIGTMMHWFSCGLVGSRGTQTPSGLVNCTVDAVGDVAVRRSAADVEAAQIASRRRCRSGCCGGATSPPKPCT